MIVHLYDFLILNRQALMLSSTMYTLPSLFLFYKLISMLFIYLEKELFSFDSRLVSTTEESPSNSFSLHCRVRCHSVGCTSMTQIHSFA